MIQSCKPHALLVIDGVVVMCRIASSSNDGSVKLWNKSTVGVCACVRVCVCVYVCMYVCTVRVVCSVDIKFGNLTTNTD